MSRRTYPRFGRVQRLKAAAVGGPCAACDDLLATHAVTIQTSWFRGDDDVLHVCPVHLAMAQRNHPGEPPQPCFADFYRLACDTYARRNPPEVTK